MIEIYVLWNEITDIRSNFILVERNSLSSIGNLFVGNKINYDQYIINCFWDLQRGEFGDRSKLIGQLAPSDIGSKFAGSGLRSP